MVYMLYRWNRLVSSSRRRFSCSCRFLGCSRTFCGFRHSSLYRPRKRILFTAVLSVLCLVPGGKMVICLYLRSRLSGISKRNGCTQ